MKTEAQSQPPVEEMGKGMHKFKSSNKIDTKISLQGPTNLVAESVWEDQDQIFNVYVDPQGLNPYMQGPVPNSHITGNPCMSVPISL